LKKIFKSENGFYKSGVMKIFPEENLIYKGKKYQQMPWEEFFPWS
jgi:hypothetical protein